MRGYTSILIEAGKYRSAGPNVKNPAQNLCKNTGRLDVCVVKQFYYFLLQELAHPFVTIECMNPSNSVVHYFRIMILMARVFLFYKSL